RELLVGFYAAGSRDTSLSQIAEHLRLPVSTVHRALVGPRRMGAVEGGRHGLTLVDPTRLLVTWAAHRRLDRDSLGTWRTGLGVADTEAHPAGTTLGGFSAYRHLVGNDVADYSLVVAYTPHVDQARDRMPPRPGPPDLLVLEPDPLLHRYGSATPLPQVYADLWNLPGWQAQRFVGRLNERLGVTDAE
ncbi:MAG: hypothetical protein ACRD0J_05915, partial [Acidimicrobiales bacterium]